MAIQIQVPRCEEYDVFPLEPEEMIQFNYNYYQLLPSDPLITHMEVT